MRTATTIVVALATFAIPATGDERTPRGKFAQGAIGPWHQADISVPFVSEPSAITVATLASGIDWAGVTDVEVGDFSGDGRPDLAVLWFATDYENMAANQRRLSFYFATGIQQFTAGPQLDLYVPNYSLPALSVFYVGTSDLGVGDYDGDGDLDLAATGYFGDELWLIENLGDGQFAQYLKFPFGYNSTGSFTTPPEVMAGDFDGDGRDELVYISDPIQRIQGRIIHFWRTPGSIASMQRVYWEGSGGELAQYTRGLAVADFDGDGRDDLCFTGTNSPPVEENPNLTFWHNLNMGTGLFAVHVEYPPFVCSDVVAVQSDAGCPPGVVLTDRNGTEIAYWRSACDGGFDFVPAAQVSGYAGLAPDRGMAVVSADVDGDGDPDLITKQKAGGVRDANQLEVTLSGSGGTAWMLVSPTPLDSTSYAVDPASNILRPRNLAALDLFGNAGPEVVAGFGTLSLVDDPALGGDGSRGPVGGEVRVLRVAYWTNGCIGDANRDGRTNYGDLGPINQMLGLCREDPGFDANADLDKDGCITTNDFDWVIEDLGCDCTR